MPRTRDLTDRQLYNLPYLDLLKVMQEIREVKEQIGKENILLEKYMQTLKEKTSERLTERLDSKPIPIASEGSTPSAEFTSSVANMMEKGVILPIEQKCEIAATEIENIKDKINAFHQQWYANITPIKVRYEELTIRAHYMKMDQADFDRDVVQEGMNTCTGKVMLEKVMLYFRRSIRNKEIQLERCRLERNTLLDMEIKIEDQLKQKEELGDTLREVDYDQLKIENVQFNERVEDRNDALLRIKYLMSLSLQYLGQYKMKLKQLTVQDKEMQEQFKIQRDNLANLEIEIEQAKQYKVKMNRHITQLQHQLENYRVPDVMDYITTQAEIYELNKIVNIWKRRVSIAARSLDAKSKQWERLKKKYKLDDTILKLDAEVNTSFIDDDADDSPSEIDTIESGK